MIALLTGELLKKKDLAPQEMQAAMEEIMSVLNTEERDQLRSLLDKLLQKLNEYSEE